MIKKAIWIGLTLSLLGLVSTTDARAQQRDRKTVLTFNQPFEIPGHVLPAGTYTFRLADSLTDRHIVQVFNADMSQIIATFMAIPDYRLEPTDQTVIKFNEVPMGSPEVIRAWFSPGDKTGHEFVYGKSRATLLAKAAKTAVPAVAVDMADVVALKTAPIVAITPDEKEVPVLSVFQTTPLGSSSIGTTGVKETSARHLPKTASGLPLLVLFGVGAIGLAAGLMIFSKRAPAVIL